ncbi:transcription factor ovo-like homolog lin-48 [Cloeon dipterum]|uniref:C2H2-type domain-containing protein n=1 Tax=Cloeon dipterum TaxID=197152 RepID=A0A8S1CIW8_9INSE|nr:Hypothetical predicted protein [Cloeon dipterum]
MFWILKRSRLTGSSFLNVLNNNSNGNQANNSSVKAQSNSSKRGYGRLPHEDPDDNHNTQQAQNSSATNSTATTPSNPPPVNHLAPELFDFELTDEFSDDSEYDEALTCNVCDRAFSTPRLLQQHQQKKRHFGCSACDSLFPSLMALEHHKEEFEHWSSADDFLSGDSETEEECADLEPSEEEERERLLL